MRRKFSILILLVLLAPTAVWGGGDPPTAASCAKSQGVWNARLKCCWTECPISITDETPDPWAEKTAATEIICTGNNAPAVIACPDPFELGEDEKDPYGAGNARTKSLRLCSTYLQSVLAVCEKEMSKPGEDGGAATQHTAAIRAIETARNTALENFWNTDLGLPDENAWKSVKDLNAKEEEWQALANSECSFPKKDATAPVCSAIFSKMQETTFDALQANLNKIADFQGSENPKKFARLPFGQNTLGEYIDRKVKTDFPFYCSETTTPTCDELINDGKSEASDLTSTAEEKRVAVEKARTVISFLQRRQQQVNLARMNTVSSVSDIGKWLTISDKTTENKLRIIPQRNTTDENNIFDKIIKLVAQAMGTFGILMLMVGAIFMITSQGDENQLQKGKQILIYTFLGLALGFLSYTIVQLFLDFLIR